MPNVTKIIGAGAKAVRTVVGSNKDIKTNKKINKTLEKTLGTKTISQGKAKAVVRNDKYGESKITKGKNSKLLAKSNKKAVIAEADKYGVSLGRVPASKTRKLKIGNTITASPTSKGFSSGTKPVPVKKKSK